MQQLKDRDKLDGTDDDPNNPRNRRVAAEQDQKAALDREFEGVADNYKKEAAEQAKAISDQEQQGAFDRDLKGIADNYREKTADPTDENSAIARAREATGAGNIVNKVTKSKPKQDSVFKKFKRMGKKKTATVLIAMILGALGISLPYMGVGLAPFMFVEGVSEDLADKVPAFRETGKRINLNRLLPNKAANEAVKGCTTLSIRCKGKTLGPKTQARYTQAGIEVTGKKVAGGRLVAEQYKLGSKTYSPPEWRNAIRTDTNVARAQLRANNPKYLSFQGSFVQRVLIRFGLAKQPAIGTKGSVADRLNQMLTNANTDDPGSLKVRQVVDADTGEPINKYELVDGNGNVVETYEGKNAARNAKSASQALDATKPNVAPKPGIKAMAGALGIIGAADVACTINNMIGAGTIAARIAASSDMVKYSWNLFSLVHKIKAGDGTADDYELVGTLLQDSDNRDEIVDLVATAANDGDELVMKPNPEKGMTAMDTEPYKTSVSGVVGAVTQSQVKASLAFDINTLLRGFGAVSGVTDTIVNLGDLRACNLIQNPLVRGGSLIAAGVAAFFSGGGSVVGQVAITGGLVAAMFILQQAINASVSGSVTDYLASGEEKVARGAFAWTGHAQAQSINAQAVGMIPANANEMAEYEVLRNETYSEIARLEASDANPFDIKNQYSVLGSISRSFYNQVGFSASPAKIIASAPALVMGAISPSAYAADTADRYKHCEDEDLLALGIEADIQCNVRYYLPEDLLSKDFDEVAKWMEDEGFVEKDTQTGLPPGYTAPNARENQNALLGALKGATIGAFKSENDLVNDYGRFLEYCTLRVTPYGKTFEEANLIGGASSGWLTGAKCRERNEMFDNFRVYTMGVAYLEDEEYEADQPISSSSSSTTSQVGGVSWVLGRQAWNKHQSDFLEWHYTGGGYLGSGSSSVDIAYTDIDGDDVFAILGGKVTRQPLGRSSYDPNTSNESNNGGLMIESQYQGGTVKIVYAHGDDVTAPLNSTVKSGDRIMAVGSVGNSTGPHIHMDISYNDKSVCPQHLFTVMGRNEQPDFDKLTKQATPTCG